MKPSERHIYPVHDQLLSRSEKEALLKQRATCFWMTGLSGSGKTTIAKGLERALHAQGFLTIVLDGDNIRAGINNNLAFTAEDRKENIRRISEVTKLFIDAGVITINCFVSPTKDIRENAKAIIGADSFVEIFIDTPLEICEQRDVKGLYAKARKGEIKDFTGIGAPFEAPTHPDINLLTENQTAEQSMQCLLEKVLTRIKK